MQAVSRPHLHNLYEIIVWLKLLQFLIGQARKRELLLIGGSRFALCSPTRDNESIRQPRLYCLAPKLFVTHPVVCRERVTCGSNEQDGFSAQLRLRLEQRTALRSWDGCRALTKVLLLPIARPERVCSAADSCTSSDVRRCICWRVPIRVLIAVVLDLRQYTYLFVTLSNPGPDSSVGLQGSMCLPLAAQEEIQV